MRGSTLLGAGIGGLTYNLTHQNWHTGTVSNNWSWGGYWGNVGIGAMTGLISGGVAAAGAGGNAAAAAGRLAFQVGGAARIAVNIAAGVVGNAGASVLGQLASNALAGHALKAGLGGAALIGGLLGGLSTGISEGIAFKLAKNFSATDYINSLSVWKQSRIGLFSQDFGETISLLQAREVEMYIPVSRFTNFSMAAPGILFTGIDALWMGADAPHW